jgi:hypothetical protein
MSNSPLTLTAINRLIARCLRQCQLAKSDAVRFYLRWACRWLNLARKSFKRGNMKWVETHVASAKREISWARQTMAIEALS